MTGIVEFKQVSRSLTERIIACAIAVHEQLGPGFLEAVYQQRLALEMKARGLQFQNNRKIPLVYRGVRISASYRFDFVVEESVLVEVRSVGNLAPIHRAQAINDLKLTGLSVALLINFNVAVFKDGVISCLPAAASRWLPLQPASCREERQPIPPAVTTTSWPSYVRRPGP